MRPAPNRFAPKQRTANDQRAELTSLLWQCRPHMLDIYTVESLSSKYSKLPPKEVECQLVVVRNKRAGEPR